MRRLFVRVHRWVGLTMTIFLVVVGLTGSVLAFREELDLWLNPELLTVTPRDTPMLDPFTLLEKALALFPDAQIDWVQLNTPPSRSVGFSITTKTADGEVTREIFFDPYTGEGLGERVWGEVSIAKKDIISFLYRLHRTLAFPVAQAARGVYLLGVVALLWTIDCFVSFYLTFPLGRRKDSDGSGRSWWSRWKPAWRIKFSGGAYRINFDIHRAFGLWTWAMLFVFAWSSVAFNLSEVYIPTMRTLFGGLHIPPEIAALAMPLDTPRLNWREAREAGHALLEEQAREHGFTVGREETLWLDRAHGVYTLSAAGPLDAPLASSGVNVTFDADTGALRDTKWPGSTPALAGDTITAWLVYLHMARVFGLPMKIFVCAMGFVITALSVTGVYIWWKKRSARRSRRERNGTPVLQRSTVDI